MNVYAAFSQAPKHLKLKERRADFQVDMNIFEQIIRSDAAQEEKASRKKGNLTVQVTI